MKQALLASVALTGILAGGPVLALDNDEMMAQLKSMQAQMAQMQREMNNLKSELAKSKELNKETIKIAQGVKDSKMALKPESDIKISMVPAPKFETADGAYSFKVGGFGQIDAGMFSDDRREHPNGTNIRRARLNASGTIAKDWRYKLEYDFSNNTSAITDMFVEYAGFEPVVLTVGQFKEPFGLETLTSDLFTTFMERAGSNLFSPDRNIGAQVSTYGDSPIGAWTAAGGVFGANASVQSADDEALDFTGRVTVAPLSVGREIVHLGLAASHRIPDSAGDTMTFQSRAENRLTTVQAVSTGAISAVDNVNLLGAEAAGVYGPFSLQGEYVKAEVNRRSTVVDQDYDGYYVEGSWFLTGESRSYVAKQGRFDRVKPKWAFNPAEDAWGAWQIAARYSVLDLNGVSIRGGEMKDTTLGLRWIPHANLSFMANYVKVDTDAFSVTPNDDPEIWMMRAQFDF